MLTNANNMEICELSQRSTMNDDQGTLLDNEQTIKDDYILSYRFVIKYIFFVWWNKNFDFFLFRHRQSEKRSLRFYLCCTFLSALLSATIIVLLSSFLFHPNNEKYFNKTIQIELLWTSGFPKLLTETAFRLVDCNSDGILDIIFGYGTGVDTLADNRLLCDLYFNGIYPCNGGVKVSKKISFNYLGIDFFLGFRWQKWTSFMELW